MQVSWLLYKPSWIPILLKTNWRCRLRTELINESDGQVKSDCKTWNVNFGHSERRFVSEVTLLILLLLSQVCRRNVSLNGSLNEPLIESYCVWCLHEKCNVQFWRKGESYVWETEQKGWRLSLQREPIHHVLRLQSQESWEGLSTKGWRRIIILGVQGLIAETGSVWPALPWKKSTTKSAFRTTLSTNKKRGYSSDILLFLYFPSQLFSW